MNSIFINGVAIVGGRNLTINNGRITVDGKEINTGNDKTINIEIHGDVEALNVDACNSIQIAGAAGSVKTLSGDVKCGNVSGSVKTMSGDVKCGNVGGDVTTMSGDISRS